VKPEQAAERRDRHFAFLLRDGNGERLGRESIRLYREHGRGFWLVSYHQTVELDASDSITEVMYLVGTAVGKLAGGNEHKRDLRRMLGRYDPRTQYVICFEEPDGRSSYRMGIT
jgi:hypothetical protein